MRAFATPGFFKPGEFMDVPEPVPGEGDVLIQVKAAGVNTTDLACMAGVMKDYMEHKFPLVPGIDASGVVEAVGPGVDGFKSGDEVFGFMRKPLVGRGTFAERVVLPANGVLRKPESLSHQEAATIPHSALTARAAVDATAPSPGALVAVVGATGGVGSYATQLLAEAGAKVIAITLGDYADYARSLGAADVIDYTSCDPVEEIRKRYPAGIDAVVDLGGISPLFGNLAELVNKGGRVVSVVLQPDTEALGARGVEGILTARWAAEEEFATMTDDIVSGKLKLPAIQTFSFAEAAAALDLQSQRHVRGKLVLLME